MKNSAPPARTWLNIGGLGLVLAAVFLATWLHGLPAGARRPEPPEAPTFVVEPVHLRSNTADAPSASPENVADRQALGHLALRTPTSISPVAQKPLTRRIV